MKVTVRFYEELNDFLKKAMRKQDIDAVFPGSRSVKDLIESLGVPHVEVDLILVNGRSVNFNYLTCDGDMISVYPVFERLNISEVQKLRDIPLRNIRFACDVHLRGLARKLRLLGFDVYHSDKSDDAELVNLSINEGRVLLTGDRQLLMRKNVTKGLCIRSSGTEKQTVEVLERLDLRSLSDPFLRCVECNGIIETISDEALNSYIDHIPAGVREWCREFFRCPSCERIYWKGSHYDRLEKVIEKLLKGL